jgi:hypothetical protein
MADAAPATDRLTLARQIGSVSFRAGIEEGRWSVVLHEFPVLVVRVTGKDFAGAVSTWMDFRMVCDGFPAVPPFVERWDPGSGVRPPPPTHDEGPPGVVDALKEWNRDGSNDEYGGVYRAWQRFAAAHNAWATKEPGEAWHRGRHLTFIMEKLHALVSEQAAWLASKTEA